jgi:hypothetical protein
MSTQRTRADNVEFVPVPKGQPKAAKSAAVKKIQIVDGERSAEDQASVDELYARRDERKPKAKLAYGGKDRDVFIDDDDDGMAAVRLMNALGVADGDFLAAIARQVSNLSSFKDGTTTTERLNEVLTQAVSLKPKDETEAMLVVQMTALHEATIRAAGAFGRESSIEGLAMLGGTLAKLSRAYAQHVETLQRKRTGNVQKIDVHHTYQGGGDKNPRVTS